MRPQSVDQNLLLRLLTKNELNHREIANRLGCSAERVRQMELELLGRTGHQAQRERRERKLQEIFEKNKFVKAAKRQGFNVEPSKRATRNWNKRELYVYAKAPKPKKMVILNGSAHAQFIFSTDQGPLLLNTILQFLQEP
jgi:hypothetical protein